jgi:hypothetical protein
MWVAIGWATSRCDFICVRTFIRGARYDFVFYRDGAREEK